jgi:hypothetical protein
VEPRAPEAVNPKMATGAIEVAASEIRLLNDAKVPPFPIADETTVAEEMRLRYRYLDLRRPRMQHNLALRHRATMATRKYFDAQGFPRDRDADAHEVHARGGARLPRAEPRASRASSTRCRSRRRSSSRS